MSECSCSKCVSACSHKPGWFMPDQIKPLADHLGLTEQELFDKHLLVDWVDTLDKDGEETDKTVYVISPAIVGADPGQQYPRSPLGVCRWLVDGKCAIHAFKPFECAEYDHNETAEVGMDIHRRIIPEAWESHQDRITELLGHEPEDSRDNIFEMLQEMMGLIPKHEPPELLPIQYPTVDLSHMSYEEVITEVKAFGGSGWYISEINAINLSIPSALEDQTMLVTFRGFPSFDTFHFTPRAGVDRAVSVSTKIIGQLYEDLKRSVAYVPNAGPNDEHYVVKDEHHA